jgi:hypothetical protein
MLEGKSLNFNNSSRSNNTENNLKPEFKVSDFPVHTMKDDLKKIDSPAAQEKKIESSSADGKESKNSPFLSQAGWDKKAPKLGGEVQPGARHSINKALITSIIIFIILIAGGAGYYFWSTRFNQPEDIPEVPLENSPEDTDTSSNETPVLSDFSTSQPNYLSLDIMNSDAAGIKNILRDYANKVSALNPSTPIEFLITDSTNNPVPFSTFAQKSTLNFPPDMLAQTKPEFSFFIYPDNGLMNFGLAISLKDGNQMETLFSQNEKNIARQLEPLYLPSTYTLPDNKSFSVSGYNGRTIHYLNITSPEELSVDYTIFNNQLMIGTTKATLRSILDYLDKQKNGAANQ